MLATQYPTLYKASTQLIGAVVISPDYIYAMRCTAHVLSTMLTTDFTSNTHPITKCSDMIIQSVTKPGCGIMKPLLKYNMNTGELEKVNTMPSGERHTFFHKILTPTKRLVGALQNNALTAKWIKSMDPLELTSRRINPDVNYAFRVARMEKNLNCAADLPIQDLITLVQLTMEFVTGHTIFLNPNVDSLNYLPTATDADMIHFITVINTMVRARFKVKTLHLPHPDCLCHTKCTNLTGAFPKLEQYFYDTVVPIHLSTRICPCSRLSHNIENTTSAKPKKCLSSHNPSFTSCSQDGCSATKLLPLYKLQVTGPLKLNYFQRMYSTQTVNVTAEIYRQSKSTATGRFFGPCFSGYRTCRKTLTDILPSRKERVRAAPFSQLEAWWRCTHCRFVPVYDRHRHDLFNESIHKDSCIDKIAVAMLKTIKTSDLCSDDGVTLHHMWDMCRGCRAAVMCRHFLTGYMTAQDHIKLTDRWIMNAYLRRLRVAQLMQQFVLDHGLVSTRLV